MTATSLYSSTALSAEGITFTKIDDNPLWVMILYAVKKKNNEYNKHAVAIIYDSYHSNKVVGHVPLYWSELANKVLKLQNHYSCVFVTGKRVNRGIVLGLEISVDYFFHGASRVTEWFKKSMKLLDKCTMLKWKYA